MKKGFTTVELLITITLLAVITVLSFQTILKFVQKSEDNQRESLYSLIESKTEEYVNDNRMMFNELGTPGASFSVELSTLEDEGLISKDLKDPVTKKKLDYTSSVTVTVVEVGKKEKYEYNG